MLVITICYKICWGGKSSRPIQFKGNLNHNDGSFILRPSDYFMIKLCRLLNLNMHIVNIFKSVYAVQNEWSKVWGIAILQSKVSRNVIHSGRDFSSTWKIFCSCQSTRLAFWDTRVYFLNLFCWFCCVCYCRCSSENNHC